jgi:hypothetical protein
MVFAGEGGLSDKAHEYKSQPAGKFVCFVIKTPKDGKSFVESWKLCNKSRLCREKGSDGCQVECGIILFRICGVEA